MEIDVTNTLELGTLLIGLFGGLALFLFGMEQMTDALKVVASGNMKKLLAQITRSRFQGALAGAAVTAVVQSSSVTTVLVVGFISAGLMSLQQSIGVIMGANIGTTVTAQVIAFKVTQYALVLVAIGFAMLFLARRELIRQYGTMIMGLGLIFFGMELMSDATRPLRSYEPFINLMLNMENPLLAILIAALFTGLVQSSSATTAIVIVLASQGFITLPTGIALAFGANIGTSITAILASIGKSREAIRAALVHVFFNVAGVLIWLAFIPQLAELVHIISPVALDLSGTEKLAAETPRQIANAHTIFNVANTLIFIGFVSPIAWLMIRLVPDKPEPERLVVQPIYLDELLLEAPALALDRTRLEIDHLGHYVVSMVRQSLDTLVHGDRKALQDLEASDDNIDTLQSAVLAYLGKLSQENLLKDQADLIPHYLAAASYLENIGDTIETNIVEAGYARLDANVRMSLATQQVLEKLHAEVLENVTAAINAFVTTDRRAAENVIQAKARVTALASSADHHLSRRLTADEADRLALYRLETDTIEYLRRIYYFAKRIAKLVLEMDGKENSHHES